MRSSLPKSASLVLIAGLVGGFAAAAIVWGLAWRPAAHSDATHVAGLPPRNGNGSGSMATEAPADAQPAATGVGDSAQRRLEALESRLAEEIGRRLELQQRIDELAADLAALRDSPSAAATEVAAAAAPPRDSRPEVDYTKSPMQRALEAAGLDEGTAEAIKLRGDQLAMTEMYLRDQAAREGWLDTPRFREEMEAIESQRTSIRDEIGDEAYDRYLFALGSTNRVIVNDVMFDSVAEDVGLQEGDLIIRYGDQRVFAPDDLIASTREGSSGEPVRLEVVRNGQRMEIEVPRGPLGLRIGPTQDDPDAS